MGLIKLSNNIKIPDMCYGSAIVSLKSNNFMKNTVKDFYRMFYKHEQFVLDRQLPKMLTLAYEKNCRLFDTSSAYGGSEYVMGQTLSKFKRNTYQIITKISNYYQLNNSVIDGFEKSLEFLKTDYIDVYLMHWPVDGLYLKTWKTMEDLYKQGKCHAIGVCNCNIHHLEKILNNCSIKPMINECECHPLFIQEDLRKYCSKNNIQFLAYTSTARHDERINNTCIVDIAKKYNKTTTQTILRWHQQIGNIPIVNTSNALHLRENLDIDDFHLTNEEISCINACNINSRLRYDPDNCDFAKL